MALASSIQNPRLGEMRVSRLPNVLMTWYPYVSRPSTIPPPPKQSTQMGIWTRSGMVPVDQTWYAVEKGAIAFETSLAPCVNDAAAAVRTWSDEYTYSARLSNLDARECMSSISHFSTALRFCIAMTSCSMPRSRKRLAFQAMTEKLVDGPGGLGGIRPSFDRESLRVEGIGDKADGGRIRSSFLSMSGCSSGRPLCTDCNNVSDARIQCNSSGVRWPW